MNDISTDKRAPIIDAIEASYEFMLAYAAQGRDREGPVGGEGLSIRQFLNDLEQALTGLDDALEADLGGLAVTEHGWQELFNFKNKVIEDAHDALLPVRAVLAVPSISSQLIDNLNASTHLRCLLTDIFVIDEALKVIQREAQQQK